MTLPEPLEQTLGQVAKLGLMARDPWWVISSAAVALHGARIDDVRDVDLLMSRSDATQALMNLGIEPRAGRATELFRSAVLGTWHAPPLPVEIFGDFEVADRAGWRRVTPKSRQPVAVGPHRLFVPSAAELKQLLIAFGRPKDITRARLLDG